MARLDDMLEDHRHAYRAELTFNPTSRTPPVAYTYDSTERAMVPDDRPLVIKPLTADELVIPDSATQSTQVGMPMSSRMLRYLQGPAPDTPWAFALKSMRAWCRRSHPHHRAHPAWRGSLCWSMVSLTVIGGYSIRNAAAILRYDDPEPVLRGALLEIEGEIDRLRAKAEWRAKEDRGLFLRCRCGHDWHRHDRPAERFTCEACDCIRFNAEERAVDPDDEVTPHHAPSPEHIRECPNPECRARREAA